MTLEIVNLRAARQFIPAVADRLWHAWWQEDGEPVSAVVAALEEVVAAPAFPFTLVALRDGIFAGTVTAVATDLDERPELGPWIAALWVDPAFRHQGIAGALVERATATMFGQGHGQVYLYAVPALRDFYRRLGWDLRERAFGRLGVDIYSRQAPATLPQGA